MAKKMAFIALAMAVVLGMVSMASAAQNVANTNQKGSLLIWPKIANEDGFRTYIYLANDYFKEVWVKCYWVDEDQNIEDFMFRLTPNQPVWFRAEDGMGTGSDDDPFALANPITVPPFQGYNGELKCWAVNEAGNSQISFNHLYGNAVIYLDGISAFEYNAWSFTARGGTFNEPFGTPGELKLTGDNGGYDACPQYLVENFYTAWGQRRLPQPALALAPCKQDLQQDRIPTCTKAKFDVWNENESKYTGAHRCIKCWYEGWLSELESPGKPYGFGYGSDKFTWDGLHTLLARFRVTGVKSTVCVNKFLTSATPPTDRCTGGQVASPLLGVLWHMLPGYGDPMVIGTTLHTAGYDGSGFVKWDKEDPHPEAVAR